MKTMTAHSPINIANILEKVIRSDKSEYINSRKLREIYSGYSTLLTPEENQAVSEYFENKNELNLPSWKIILVEGVFLYRGVLTKEYTLNCTECDYCSPNVTNVKEILLSKAKPCPDCQTIIEPSEDNIYSIYRK